MGKEPFFRRIFTRFLALDRLTKALVMAFALAGLTTGALAFGAVRNFVMSTTSFQLPGLAVTSGDPEQPAVVEQLGPVLEPWDGASRVNILVMGLDARDWEASQGPPKTDSMMVFTIDPVTKTAGMFSIPRDLWIDIPGFGYDKINTAYQLGEGARLPGGGAGLAVKTVEQFLGVTINYYAQIDFRAFERFIDEIGGAKIDVQKKCRIQLIGEEQHRVIQKGIQTLNGAYTLAYARSRDPRCGDGDFDRARRQQEVAIAIRDRLLNPFVQAKILSDGLRIYQELSGGLNTNMTFDEIVRMGWLAKDIDPANIVRAIIAPPDYVTLDTSPDGLSILKPLTENIRQLRDQVFTTGSTRSQLALNTEASELMHMEAAQVAIYNGAGVAGIADNTRAYLEGQGVLINATGNADLVSATTIYDYTGNPYTVQWLVQVFNVAPTHIFSRYDPGSQVDIELIVGPEWVVPTS